jgi:AraC family transcriptional regulator
MELLARIRIVSWEGASLWISDATRAQGAEPRRTDFHAHHAIQLTIGLGGWFKLDTVGASVRGDAVAVSADVQHVFEAEGLMAFLFVEPESRQGRAIGRRFFNDADLVTVPPEALGDFRERVMSAYGTQPRDDLALIAIGRDLLTRLSADARIEEPDPRIKKVITWAAQQIDEPVGLADAVTISGLSASRLRHLFVEQTGLPFKTYLLWLRLTRAVESFAAGASLTQAAHQAGFSDSAHLSRTFRRMFGIAPASVRMV